MAANERSTTPPPAASIPSLRKHLKGILNLCGSQQFVTITTGVNSAQEVFTVHKNVISYHSLIFKTAFGSNYRESQTLSVALDDVEGIIFGLLVDWLYLQELQHPDDRKVLQIEMAKLWLLGDRFLMPALQNCAMGELHCGGVEDWTINSNGEDTVFESAREFFDYVLRECTPKPLLRFARWGLISDCSGLEDHPDRPSLWKAFLPEHMVIMIAEDNTYKGDISIETILIDKYYD